MSIVPVLDLADYLSDDIVRKQKFIQDFGKAYEEIGFAAIENHGIPPELIQSFYKSIQEFFAMPTEEKLKYEIVELAGQRGYTSFGREKAKQSEVADLKEFFQFGQYIEDGEKMLEEDYPDNVQVKEVADFNKIVPKF